MRRGRKSPLASGLLAVLIIVVLTANTTGCVCTADWCATFRDVANPAFESAIISALTGVVGGIFALLATEDDSASASQTAYTGSSSTTTTTTP